MPENPFVRMYRDLVRRINEMPQVRLSRADPEAPAEPAEGWALSVGRQRVALGVAPAPISDTGWQPLELMSGFTGDIAPQWRVRDGWAMLRGRVTRTAGNWTNSNYQFAVTPAAALPTRLLYTVAVARGGHVLTAAIDHRLQITSAAATAEVHLESIPPWRVD